MRGTLVLIASVYYLFVIVFSIYISLTKIKPTVEKYTDIDWFRTKTFEKYKLMYVDYRKICKDNGLSVSYGNIMNTITVIALLIFLLFIFTM